MGIDGNQEICYPYLRVIPPYKNVPLGTAIPVPSSKKGKELGREFVMYIKQATVNNQVGLHARPATFFIQKANEFKSTIWVEKDEQRVNAKSLLGVLSLGIIKGSTIDLIADGTDEKDAVDALVELISSDFAD
jgi:phosphocarrier protein